MNYLSIRSSAMSDVIQHNLSTSASKLNLSMQRIASGYKINSAKDDAANLCISTKMDTKISGLEVANNNINNGLSTLNSISSTFDSITSDLQKLRDLAVEAANGTYSSDDCTAINTEAQAIITQINSEASKSNKSTGASAFTNYVNSLSEAQAIAKGYDSSHIITSATDFVSKINSDLSGSFILTSDLDMSTLGTLTTAAISGTFTGKLDGNGCCVNNLTINTGSTGPYNIGLFSVISSGAEIQNLGMNNINITAKNASCVGGICGLMLDNTSIKNCFATGSLSGMQNVGLSVGMAPNDNSIISDCYTKGSVTGDQSVGGFIGLSSINITNSYSSADVNSSIGIAGGFCGMAESSSYLNNVSASGSVICNGFITGGLVGYNEGTIINSNATGNVTGNGSVVGGLVGKNSNNSITNVYATGNVISNSNEVGGLVGLSSDCDITNAYATGDVTGEDGTGGLVGYSTNSRITNVYATGNVTSDGYEVGGLAGYSSGAISNAFATGDVTGNTYTGGLFGSGNNTVANTYATGSVTGKEYVGGLVGYAYLGNISDSYATGNTTGIEMVGGFVGYMPNGATKDSYSSGYITGTSDVGGFAGYASGSTVDNTNSWNIITSGQTTSAGSAVGVTKYNLPTITVNIDSSNIGYQSNSGTLTLQTGTDSADTYKIKNLDIDIDLSKVDLSDGTSANSSIELIDDALTSISTKNTNLGASINALECKITANTTNSTSLTNANSTIKDADIAEETANFIKQKILQQSNAYLLNENNGRMKEILLSLLPQS